MLNKLGGHTIANATKEENESFEDVTFTGTATRIKEGHYNVNGFTVKKMFIKSYWGQQWKVIETGHEYYNLKNAKKDLEGKQHEEEVETVVVSNEEEAKPVTIKHEAKEYVEEPLLDMSSSSTYYEEKTATVTSALHGVNMAEVARNASIILGEEVSRNTVKNLKNMTQKPRADRFLAIAEALGFSVNLTVPYTVNKDGTYTSYDLTIRPCNDLYIVCHSDSLIQSFKTLHEACVFCKNFKT